jgi:hypothetical protein
LHFIQEAVDAMEYSRQGDKNQLRLVKYLPAPEPKPEITKGE